MGDIELITISIGIPILFSLYLFCLSIEYKESIRRLQRDNKSLREANRNLAEIVQKDLNKKDEYESGCG